MKAPESMVIETDGKPMLSGLKKRDHFSSDWCIYTYSDVRCIVDQNVIHVIM